MKFYISDVVRILSAIGIWLLIMGFLKNSVIGLLAVGAYYLGVYLLVWFSPVIILIAVIRYRKKHAAQR